MGTGSLTLSIAFEKVRIRLVAKRVMGKINAIQERTKAASAKVSPEEGRMREKKLSF